MGRRRGGEARTARQPRRRRSWLIGFGTAIVALLVAGGAGLARRSLSAARLPSLPDLSALPPAVRDHLSERYAAARENSTSADAVGLLCLALHADLFYEQADRCHALAASLNPSDWRWAYYRALLQSERGGGEALIATLRSVVRKQDFGPAWLRLGEAEFKAGRYDEAETAWKRAASSLEPDRTGDTPPHVVEGLLSAYASLGLARIALARGDPDGARATLERVTASAPRFGPAFRLLAECYTVLGHQADANGAIARANRLPPYAPYADPLVDALARESQNSTFLLRQASEADLSINGAWSEYLARRALEFDPNNPDVVAKLGRILRTLGRDEEALDAFARYHLMVPGDLQGAAQLGSVLSDLGRFDEAEPLLRRALRGLDDALTHYNLALLLARTGRIDEAAGYYTSAVARDPADTSARMNLASVLVRQGKLSDAARELQHLLETDPDNAAAHTNYGIVLLRQKQVDRATREFEAALRLDPRQAEASEALQTIKR